MPLLKEEQCGFRPGMSTITQLTRLVDDITTNFNIKKHTGLVSLDVEKAFDTVWHEGLLYCLITYNFPPYLIKLIRVASYLSYRIFFCKY